MRATPAIGSAIATPGAGPGAAALEDAGAAAGGVPVCGEGTIACCGGGEVAAAPDCVVEAVDREDDLPRAHRASIVPPGAKAEGTSKEGTTRLAGDRGKGILLPDLMFVK